MVAVGDDVCCRRVLIMGDEKGIPFETLIPLKQIEWNDCFFLSCLTLLPSSVAAGLLNSGGGLIPTSLLCLSLNAFFHIFRFMEVV